jgi:hypothetical protein
LAEIVEGKKEALRVAEIALILNVLIKTIRKRPDSVFQDFPYVKIRPAGYSDVVEKPVQDEFRLDSFVVRSCLSKEE